MTTDADRRRSLPDNIVADRHGTSGKWTLQYLTDDQFLLCRAALAGRGELNEAIQGVMVGGNYLASFLIGAMGPNFHKYKNYDDVLYHHGQPDADMWIAWKKIMELRDKREHLNAPSNLEAPAQQQNSGGSYGVSASPSEGMEPSSNAGSPESRPNAHDWPEDFGHENGNYTCLCALCGKYFKGHKCRLVCKICTKPRPDAIEGLEEREKRLNPLIRVPGTATIESLPDEARNAIDGMQQALIIAASTFRRYEAIHAAKPDLVKAQWNGDMAFLLESALDKYAPFDPARFTYVRLPE